MAPRIRWGRLLGGNLEPPPWLRTSPSLGALSGSERRGQASHDQRSVERYVGFERAQDEYGGDWAMAKYIGATEMGNEDERSAVMDQILTCNRED